MTPFRLILASILTVFLVACSSATIPTDARTTLIILRHADRSGELLSKDGHARSANLPAALAAYKIDAIYLPNVDRNRQTAAPLARATGAPVKVLLADKIAGQLASAHPNGTAVWVGNKTNLKPLWQELNLPGEPPLTYGDIAVVRLKTLGRRSVKWLRFEVN